MKIYTTLILLLALYIGYQGMQRDHDYALQNALRWEENKAVAQDLAFFRRVVTNNYSLRLPVVDHLDNYLPPSPRGWVEVNAEDSGYMTLAVNFGNIIVATQKVEPEGDGYRISIYLGNINACTLNGFDIILGSRNPAELHNYKSIEFTNSFDFPIKAGEDITASCLCAPLSLEGLRELSFTVKSDHVSFPGNPVSVLAMPHRISRNFLPSELAAQTSKR